MIALPYFSCYTFLMMVFHVKRLMVSLMFKLWQLQFISLIMRHYILITDLTINRCSKSLPRILIIQFSCENKRWVLFNSLQVNTNFPTCLVGAKSWSKHSTYRCTLLIRAIRLNREQNQNKADVISKEQK